MSIRRSFQNVFSRFLTSEWTNKIPANVRHFFHPASGQPQRSPKPYTIIVEGNIGSGKTTFLEPFTKSHQDQVEILSEPVDLWRNCQGHNLLQLMYEDPARYSLAFQTYVQLTMVKLHNQHTDKPIRLMERSMLSARYCFVENLVNNGLMSDCEYAVISEWFNYLITCPLLNFKVDQIIYLRTRPEVAYERILSRQRAEENKIPFKYIKDLHELHEEWLVQKTKFQPLMAPVTIVDANDNLEALSEKYSDLKRQILRKNL